jgi:hypothetical protein
MADFFLTLPSNVSRNDSTNKYTIRLPKKLQLNGSWEVALVEIQYPYSWKNITGQLQADRQTDNWIDISFTNGSVVTLFVPPGHYPTAQKLIDGIEFAKEKLSESIQTALSELRKQEKTNRVDGGGEGKKKKNKKYHLPELHTDVYNFAFTYNDTLKRVLFKGQRNTIKSVELSEKLKYMLGFETRLFYETEKVWAKYTPDMRNGFYSLYLYCDMVEPQIVGNTIIPLLRTVHIEGNHGDIIEKLYNAPHYVQLNKKEIDQISIEVRDDRDQLVPFDFGKIVVKLHFRKKRLL